VTQIRSMAVPTFRFQSRVVPSSLPLASACPSGLNATDFRLRRGPSGSPPTAAGQDRGSRHAWQYRGCGGPARPTGCQGTVNLNVLNVRYPGSVREMGIQEARPVLGDLVRDAQRHGIETLITRNGRPAARITRLGGPGGNAAECEKILAGYADDPGMELTGSEREAISVVRDVLARMADKERDAR